MNETFIVWFELMWIVTKTLGTRTEKSRALCAYVNNFDEIMFRFVPKNISFTTKAHKLLSFGFVFMNGDQDAF